MKRVRGKRRLQLLPVLIGLCILAVPAAASADAQDFVITDFSAVEKLTRDDPQGKLQITEAIKVDFHDYNHGILRAIPESYHGHTVKLHVDSVSSESGAPAQYTASTSNGNLVLKIGDPSRTVTGNQEYDIAYTVQNVIDFRSSTDALYWDVNGDQWPQPVDHADVTLRLPDGLKLASAEPQCFTGTYGSAGQDCVVAMPQSDTLTAAAVNLAPDTTLTYLVQFQKGYFAPMTRWESLRDYAPEILGFAVPALLGAGLGLARWLRGGRDAKGRGTIVPEYAPPAGMTPLEAGTVADFKTDNRDITATYIDLARRGYIRIIENRVDHKLIKDAVTYTLELRNTDWSDCDAYETQLLAATFAGKAIGEKLGLNDAKYAKTLYQTAKSLRKSLGADLTRAGYFRSNPTKYTGGAVAFLLVVVIGAQFISSVVANPAGIGLLAGCAVGVVAWLLFRQAMPARTAAGVAAREHLLGLKMYMEVAEKDRLAMQEGPNAKYAANYGAPERTVELFEKLLPYAIVLQVEKQWADKFNDIYTQPPEWYAGNWTAFNVGYMAGSLNNGFAGAINQSFAAPSSAGAGGGGFAGGGGGGGGGGGW